ncbi:DNA-processing protein DprA [Aneurinibacillus danicus]|jgi:DNA processing protein|uniref:DNA polymerase n=1 Tax=Aneurinibacillus danicus TaxID=267746 RepID=A0A511V595_9BACL|nr:DNA-processing protein DprA [Aneurinibacillus danicus]GEN34117.1 DNA polymerase [Aneurinibacillus danicus]
MEKREYMLLALSHINRVGRTVLRAARKLDEAVDFSRCSVQDIQKMLAVSPKVAEKIRMEFSLRDAVSRVQRWQAEGIGLLTQCSSEYPALLREIPDPPEVLYIIGNKTLLHQPSFAIIGTRKPTAYGKTVARQMARELAERGVTIVSGMARGIDGEAHRGALAGGGSTIAVLGCGVNIVYPPENRALAMEIRQKGLIVSEYPPGMEPQRGFFPERNRIISGLSQGVLVVEAASRSGSLITADLAIDQGRDVFAIPGSIHSPKSAGSHWLIQQGAKLTQTIQDILNEYPMLVSGVNKSVACTDDHGLLSLTPEEEIVLAAVGWEAVSYEEILCRTSFSSSYLHYLLLSLQVKQQVIQLPGPAFVRIKNRNDV